MKKNADRPTLAQRLRNLDKFFEPKNLDELLVKYEGRTALLVVDVQDTFCHPESPRGNAETVAVAEHIQSLAPAFREASIPVYAVYFSYGDLPADKIDFYKFRPDEKDTLISKKKDSAFEENETGDILKKDGRKLLLVCGFNQAACVRATVTDARKAGFQVCLLEDLAGNGNDIDKKPISAAQADIAWQAMQRVGARKASAPEVLKYLKISSAL